MLAVWAFLRWPLVVLLKAPVMAALESALRDEEARESFARVLREQLLKPEVTLLARSGEVLEHQEEPPGSTHLPRRSTRR